ncbi:MAG: CotH kinase family protein, partial [Bacteroidaceae bacterium]|nr:CotH kinase family protein [Bacteroidaceae bacterium]
MLLIFFLSVTTHVKAEQFDVFKESCLFVTLAEGGVDAYPLSALKGEYYIEDDYACIETNWGDIAKYHISEYISIDTEIPQLPHMKSYKFNNKYNPNLNQDVIAEEIAEVIHLKANAIGKSLTASFQLSDSEAVAYIGKELQISKESRNRFDKAISYTVTYPGYDLITQEGRIPFGRIYTIETEWLTDNGKVARIDIDIEKGHTVTSRNYYLKAIFSITGYGMYDDFSDSVQIKGRGNNSWNYKKKSYRLKFGEKKKPFGLTKGKSWVLLANPQHGSLMVNAIAMKIGQLAGAKYTNHIIPVELYINGKYQGSYIFTEKVGFSNNSVDVDEEYGYMLELDSYYDEDFKFRSSHSNLPVNNKEPKLAEEKEGDVSSTVLESMLNDNCANTIPSQKFPDSS